MTVCRSPRRPRRDDDTTRSTLTQRSAYGAAAESCNHFQEKSRAGISLLFALSNAAITMLRTAL
jgi:hypothetical protein